MDRGSEDVPSGDKRGRPGDWAERLIVVLLFAVSVAGIYALTGSLPPALLVGVLVGAVAYGVVTLL